MRVLLLEPFFGGSHRQWAEGFQQRSSHQVTILSLPAYHWKWRMHGAAMSLAKRFMESDLVPDLILATDMLDLACFLSITRKRTAGIPTVIYFHENQLTYPWSGSDEDVAVQRDLHYAFINYTSALVADHVFFNSEYHRNSFLSELPHFLGRFPDHQNLHSVEQIRDKSSVLHLGLDLTGLETVQPSQINKPKEAVILWNHRWEYDKNPEEFFRSLYTIQERGAEFRLVVLGQRFPTSPKVFVEAEKVLKDRIIHCGYVSDRSEYARWLFTSDILPVTSYQDFFGISVVEAMFCNVKPLLPGRLAYAEHIPLSQHDMFFYEDDLTDRLLRMIADVNFLRDQQTRSYVQKYDWLEMIESYDRILEQIVT
jgi:glycosyltransferase involved in cell wall biosynthesis